MFSKLVGLLALQALIGTTLAGNAIIVNKCKYPLTLLSTATNKQSTIGAGARYSEPLSGHQSLKLSKDAAGLYANRLTQFEYSVADTLWYDISLVNCANVATKDATKCPGHEGGMTISASGGDCATGTCAPGAWCNKDVYFAWNDDLATKSCKPGQNKGDITMTLCAQGKKRSVAGRVEY